MKASSGIEKKDGSWIGNKGQAGYITYGAGGDSDTGISGKAGKTYDSIDAGKLALSPNANNASVFTKHDAEIFIAAIKKNRDLKLPKLINTLKFELESMPKKDQASNFDYARKLMMKYFIRLCKDDRNAENWIKPAEPNLYMTVKPMKHPLAGNSFMKIFSNAYNNSDLHANFHPNNRFITLFSNLVAGRIMSIDQLQKPANFLSTICFNENITDYVSREISQIFHYFSDIKNLAEKPDKLDNEVLRKWDKVSTQLARQCILGPDSFRDDLINNNLTEAEVNGLDELGKDPSDVKLFTSPIQSPESLEQMVIALKKPKTEEERPAESDDEDGSAGEDTSFDKTKFYEVEPSSGTDTSDRRQDVKLKKGDRFVGLDGKIYAARENGKYDIKKGSKIYIPVR